MDFYYVFLAACKLMLLGTLIPVRQGCISAYYIMHKNLTLRKVVGKMHTAYAKKRTQFQQVSHNTQGEQSLKIREYRGRRASASFANNISFH